MLSTTRSGSQSVPIPINIPSSLAFWGSSCLSSSSSLYQLSCGFNEKLPWNRFEKLFLHEKPKFSDSLSVCPKFRRLITQAWTPMGVGKGYQKSASHIWKNFQQSKLIFKQESAQYQSFWRYSTQILPAWLKCPKYKSLKFLVFNIGYLIYSFYKKWRLRYGLETFRSPTFGSVFENEIWHP